jgi:hypothetical protein|uniref:Uncharacterized protein n=1 Tax=Picea glauca TaxID=3330 RepID=A0A101LTX5_PICGL|nr:hypothetical protein ABT39_MTgene3505 [Picea glauca]
MDGYFFMGKSVFRMTPLFVRQYFEGFRMVYDRISENDLRPTYFLNL